MATYVPVILIYVVYPRRGQDGKTLQTMLKGSDGALLTEDRKMIDENVMAAFASS